jgi:hypothetical protein
LKKVRSSRSPPVLKLNWKGTLVRLLTGFCVSLARGPDIVLRLFWWHRYLRKERLRQVAHRDWQQSKRDRNVPGSTARCRDHRHVTLEEDQKKRRTCRDRSVANVAVSLPARGLLGLFSAASNSLPGWVRAPPYFFSSRHVLLRLSQRSLPLPYRRCGSYPSVRRGSPVMR